MPKPKRAGPLILPVVPVSLIKYAISSAASWPRQLLVAALRHAEDAVSVLLTCVHAATCMASATNIELKDSKTSDAPWCVTRASTAQNVPQKFHRRR